MQFSKLRIKDEKPTFEMEIDKEKVFDITTKLVNWIFEEEEKAIIETLAKNYGVEPLKRLRDIIDKALEAKGE